MLSDRELDALVAEKVMGCKPMLGAGGAYHRCGCSDVESPEGHDAVVRQGAIGIFGAAIRLPYYSTDIAAAWLVVEKMRERGITFRCGSYVKDECFAEFGGQHLSAPAKGGDFPKAICLAALKALGASTGSGEDGRD